MASWDKPKEKVGLHPTSKVFRLGVWVPVHKLDGSVDKVFVPYHGK